GVGLSDVISQTDTQRDNNNLLLWVDNEIMSIGQITALGSGRYKMFVRRALYGTAEAAHSVNADCFFIFKNKLTRIQAANFAAGATRYFKLQPYTPLNQLDLSQVTSISHTFPAGPAVGSVFSISLSTASGIAEGKIPDIRIVAIWDAVSDQDIVQFEANYQKPTDANW